jgi:hypothetical protein
MAFEIPKVRFRVKVTFTDRVLGSSPADPEVYKKFIADKKVEADEKRKAFAERHGMPEPEKLGTPEEELETLGVEGTEGITVFHNDLGGKDLTTGEEGKGLFFYNYAVKGQLKEAARVLESVHGMKQPKVRLDTLLFVHPRRIYVFRDGEVLQKADDRLERPLRAETMRGPRVALACSEMIHPGCSLEYEVEIIDLLKTTMNKTGKKVNAKDLLDLCLQYGAYIGLGQWRNGGNGTFNYELTKLTEDVGKPADEPPTEEPPAEGPEVTR